MQALLFGHLATFVLSGFRYVAQIIFYLSLAVFSLSLTILSLLFTEIPFLFTDKQRNRRGMRGTERCTSEEHHFPSVKEEVAGNEVFTAGR